MTVATEEHVGMHWRDDVQEYFTHKLCPALNLAFSKNLGPLGKRIRRRKINILFIFNYKLPQEKIPVISVSSIKYFKSS